MTVIYLCPTHKRLLCDWEGPACDIKQHFEEEHNSLLFRTNVVDIDLEALPENKILYLEGELYLMQIDIKDGKLDVKLRYLGPHELAAKFQYDIVFTANDVSYKYEPSRYFSCVVPNPNGWEINVDCLKNFHGTLTKVTCTVLLEGTTVFERKMSDIFLKINNPVVEQNVMDQTELNYLEGMHIADERLKELKKMQADAEQKTEENNVEKEKVQIEQKRKRQKSDLLDNVSQLNFSLLEELCFNNGETCKEDNLSCSTCGLDMIPYIYLCFEGHNVCTPCKNQPCKRCGSPITNNRNTELENLSRTHKHQCKYASEGCNGRFSYVYLREHEHQCHFCKYKCVTDNCPFEGKFDHFKNHLKVVHSSIKICHSTKNDFPKNTEMYVVNETIGIFYCQSEIVNDYITWKVTFCGPTERCFLCQIGFKSSKSKETISLTKNKHIYEFRKPIAELKKNKIKYKYAVLDITKIGT